MHRATDARILLKTAVLVNNCSVTPWLASLEGMQAMLSQYRRSQCWPAANKIRRLFRDHDHCRVDIAADHVRHDGGVAHPQVLAAMDAQLTVDDGHPVIRRAHAAGAEWMVHGDARGGDMGIEPGIGP